MPQIIDKPCLPVTTWECKVPPRSGNCRGLGRHRRDGADMYEGKARPYMAARMTAVERILLRIQPQEDGGCWLWTGSRDQLGYGHVRDDDGKSSFAHRILYKYYVGDVPAGLELDHLCRTPSCCRPDHLQAVTHRENVLRGKGIPAENAKKTHCKHGHEFSPQNTYARDGHGRGCRTCRAQARRRHRELYGK